MVAAGAIPGLYVQITPNGSKSWVLRFSSPTTGKRREAGLGQIPEVTMQAAYDAARAARDLVKTGVDPIDRRNDDRAALAAEAKADAASRVTFAEAAERAIAVKVVEFKNAKHAKQWGSTIETYANPVIGNLTVDAVEREDVINILKPIWTVKTETANRLRQRLEYIFAWATVEGLRTKSNPATWRNNLSFALPSPAKLKAQGSKNWPSLHWSEVPEFLASLSMRDGEAVRALRLAILCASRSGEVRHARWRDFDVDNAVWTIPADQMKAGREHVVPLSKEAAALLKAMPVGDGLIFSSSSGNALSDMAISAAVRRMHKDRVEAGGVGWIDRTSGRRVVPHGFRSSFRTWVAEQTDFSPDLAEHALAHRVGNAVERVYSRTQMVERRRDLMQAWADYILRIK